jgi:hypothetical protein
VFETRTTGFEFLDSPGFDETLAARSYSFMEIVNRRLGGTRIARNFLFEQAFKNKGRLNILDIGSGTCDIPITLAMQAKNNSLDVKFTCVENNPTALAIARRKIAYHQDLQISLVDSDIFDFTPPVQFDCASGSLFFHHLTNPDIIRLLYKLEKLGCRSVLINDLHRCATCYFACAAACAFSAKEIRHDALTSIKRGFTKPELLLLLSKFRSASVRVNTSFFCRISAVIDFEGEHR